MNEPQDRRAAHEHAPEDFSPEYLAMLVVCGGSVRDSDWAVLPPSLAARRHAGASFQRPAGEPTRPSFALR